MYADLEGTKYEKQIPFLWVEQSPDGKWKWCLGSRTTASGLKKPSYVSPGKFKTERLAQQNAIIRLMGDRTSFDSTFDLRPFLSKNDCNSDVEIDFME